ncbi:MAG: alpha/beta hydrolase, partial [Bacteroidia bacterium]|nr:alpha/beta hydrolase [Bacteroidia bacterium]
AMDYDVLVMDYRGYGKSKGPLSETALYNDGQKCYNYLLQRYAEDDISIYGRSLGAAVASKIAAANQPKRLIMESPFYSVADVAQERFPLFPVKKLLRYQLPNFEHVKSVNCPITIFHGTDDFVVPYTSGEKLSREKTTQFIAIEGGGHNDLITFEKYRTAIKELLKK